MATHGQESVSTAAITWMKWLGYCKIMEILVSRLMFVSAISPISCSVMHVQLHF